MRDRKALKYAPRSAEVHGSSRRGPDSLRIVSSAPRTWFAELD
jgi:hypothetical protein